MIKVIIWGAGGRMGQVLATLCRNDEETELVAGIDKFANPADFSYKIYNDANECNEVSDVIIDFSRPEALDDILEFSAKKNMPVVLATTGYDEKQLEKIKEHSKKVAVFRSFNMSLGINLLISLAKKATKTLGSGFDIEIIEKHHNQKVDSPSGTALMLADAIRETRQDCSYVFGRHGTDTKRKPSEIGIHAVRGGTIVGQHDVIFAGNNEVITLSHAAESKENFASGALSSAKFIKEKKQAGLYNMSDIFS